MSSSGGNGTGLNSDDQSNKDTMAKNPNATVSLPVSLSVPSEDVGTDENLEDFDNEKYLEEMAGTNQTSIDMDTQLLLAEIHEENQELYEEVLKQTEKNNTALAKQSELYDKLILGASKSNSPDTNVKPSGKRLLGKEETSKAGSKKIQKLDSDKKDPSSKDQKD